MLLTNLKESTIDKVINAYCDFTGGFYETAVYGDGSPVWRISLPDEDMVCFSEDEFIDTILYNLSCIVENMEV